MCPPVAPLGRLRRHQRCDDAPYYTTPRFIRFVPAKSFVGQSAAPIPFDGEGRSSYRVRITRLVFRQCDSPSSAPRIPRAPRLGRLSPCGFLYWLCRGHRRPLLDGLVPSRAPNQNICTDEMILAPSPLPPSSSRLGRDTVVVIEVTIVVIEATLVIAQSICRPSLTPPRSTSLQPGQTHPQGKSFPRRYLTKLVFPTECWLRRSATSLESKTDEGLRGGEWK